MGRSKKQKTNDLEASAVPVAAEAEIVLEEASKPPIKYAPILDAYLLAIVGGSKRPNTVVAEQLNLEPSYISSVINRKDSKAYLRKQVDAYLKESDVQKIRVFEELKKIAFANPKDIGHFDGENMNFYDWDEVDDAALAGVAEIQTQENAKGLKTTKFRFNNKQPALDLLVKILGMSEQTVKHTGNVEIGVKRLFDE